MTNSADHRATSLDHLAAVSAHSDALRDEWSKDRPNSQESRYLTASIGRGLKLAEIHAALHIGAQLERLADRLEDDDLADFVRRTSSPPIGTIPAGGRQVYPRPSPYGGV